MLSCPRANGVAAAGDPRGREAGPTYFRSPADGHPRYKFSVADYEACAEVVKRIEGEVGTVEILVNNAGITRDATMKRLSREQWDAVIDTNLGSCYNMCKILWVGE